MEKLKQIIVEKRANDYMAYINDHKGLWGCGKHPAIAIGEAIKNHSEKFNIDIKYTNPCGFI